MSRGEIIGLKLSLKYLETFLGQDTNNLSYNI